MLSLRQRLVRVLRFFTVLKRLISTTRKWRHGEISYEQLEFDFASGSKKEE
jgi:hypothetical protein